MQKILLPALAVLFLLAGGTVGFMKWMQFGPFAVEGGEEDEARPAARRGEQPRYLDINPINVVVIQDNRPRTTVQITVKLEFANEKNLAVVQRRTDRLTHALITDLHDFLPRLLREVDHIDLALLQERMQYVADRIYGKGIVQQVLIQSVHDTAGKT